MADNMIIKQILHFKTDSKPIFCTPYGLGHINQTYLVVDETANSYILQKINKKVFVKPDQLMSNIAAVTNWLKKSAGSHREALELIPTDSGELWFVDGEGEFWRMYRFISDSICLQMAGTEADFAESGYAFGRFRQMLNDFPADSLYDTIPRFHDTPLRYQQFHEAIKNDAFGRVKNVSPEIDFVLKHEEYAGKLLSLQEKGELKLKVTHNDTKLNNVLLDRCTRKALCVIDLDTVMPGLLVNDFGDSIRFGATTAPEDERDLTKVNFSLPLFSAYTKSFLNACRDSITGSEREYLCDGAKMMTLECGMRFLGDYLNGDIYFRIKREEQNLDRSRTQFKLVEGMEKTWDEMQVIVKNGC